MVGDPHSQQERPLHTEHEGPIASLFCSPALQIISFSQELIWGQIREKKIPTPSLQPHPRCCGVFSHFPQPIPCPAEVKPLFGSMALI